MLERGCVYIAELQERLAPAAGRLRPAPIRRAPPAGSTCSCACSPTTAPAFDDVAEGYDGPLYLEIAPQTFSVLVRTGTRLNQLRLKRGEPPHAVDAQTSAST